MTPIRTPIKRHRDLNFVPVTVKNRVFVKNKNGQNRSRDLAVIIFVIRQNSVTNPVHGP